MKHYPALAHGTFDEVFDGVWFIQGAVKMPMMIPMKFSRSMTVVRIQGTDELVIINSMRLNDEGLAALDKLGKVKHVIRIAAFHGRDDGFYRERYNAKLFALEGQFYSRSMDAKKPRESYLEPDEWLTQESQLPVPGASLRVMATSSPPEGILRLSEHGGILVTGDSLQNTPTPDRFVNLPAKLMMKKMGFFKPYQVGPGWLEFAAPSEDEVRSISELEFEHVLPGHGHPVVGGAKGKYLPSIQGNLKGCHS